MTRTHRDRQGPATVIVGARVRDCRGDLSTQEALAFADGRVLGIGTESEMRALAGKGAQEIDLRGATLMPGLVDTHPHMLHFAARSGPLVDLADAAALNSSSGALLWEKKIGNTIDISSPTLSGGLLFIGTRDFEGGAFFALNETTGDILWKYPVGASVTAPPSIADGMMLCGTDSWNMYAFDFGIGTGDWLLHRYDSCNTAFSANGLTEWQFVSASCTTVNDITTCSVTNTYDQDVTDVKLKLSDEDNENWYDISGHLLQSESKDYVIEDLTSLSTETFIITTAEIHQPGKPTISGTSSGKIGTKYTYVVSAVDPDGSNLSYYQLLFLHSQPLLILFPSDQTRC